MAGEKAGRDLLLKLGESITASCAGNATFSCAGHGLSAGDLVQFGTAEGSITTTRMYFVVDGTVDGTNTNPIDGTKFFVALTPDGTSLIATTTDGTIPLTVYKTVGGLRTSSFAFKAAEIETSNYGSNEWKYIKAGAGMRSVAIQGQGIYTNAANFRTLETQSFANALVSMAFLDIDGGRIYSGSFKIASLDNSGKYDGEATYSISANSSGTVSIAQLGT
jgi:predicted secreted protein